MSKEDPTQQLWRQLPKITQEHVEMYKAEESGVRKAYKKLSINRKKMTQMYNLIVQCNLHDYIQSQSKIFNASLFTTFFLSSFILFKVRRISFRIIGIGSCFAFYTSILQQNYQYSRVKSIALQQNFTVEEQEIRNIFEWYFKEDPASKRIAQLTNTYLELQELKSAINRRRMI